MIVRQHKQRLHALLPAGTSAAGLPDPRTAADQLLLLVDGVLVAAVAHPQTRPATAARALAEAVLRG